MSLYGLYVIFAVLNRKHSYLFISEEFFRKFTFLILTTIIMGTLVILIVILTQYEGKTELTILQNDKNTLNTLNPLPSSPKAKAEYHFDYLILETNTAAIWRRAKIKLPSNNSSIQIEPTDVYIRTSNDKDRVYNLQVDYNLDTSSEKMKISFLFKDFKSLKDDVSEIQKVLIH